MDFECQWLDALQYPHHRQAVLGLRDEFINDPSVMALIVGGSICHGYARPDSDVDCVLLVDDEECELRRRENRIHYYSTHLTPYEGGYVDGKYQSVSYLEKVADYGSEPARFAFKDARIVFTRIDALEELLRRASAYPENDRVNRIIRFHAQLDGMRWFFGEGVKRADRYTVNWSAAGMVMFGSRMLLAHNRVLFPCHKTMTHELRRCSGLPDGIFDRMEGLLGNPTEESAEAYYRAVKDWREWEESPGGWPNQFMADSELKWLTGDAPVSDI
jgi:hypothetical protein